VVEFDADGNFIQAWGGRGEGYEWPAPEAEHGIFVDYKGYVWIGGNGTDPTPTGNDQILKFTKDGKFVMQIGHYGQSKGNTDQNNMSGPADMSVYPKTNEVFVADGFFNRRVIVFDADTGAFKRMWGAFGNVPTDHPKSFRPYLGSQGAVPIVPQDIEGPGPPQFDNLHCLRVSNDGLVYVCDKANRRIQVFTIEGKYLTQVFISRGKLPPSTLTGMAYGKPRREIDDELRQSLTSASSVAFSPDPQQRFMYVADRRRGQVLIYDRKTLEYLGAFGDGPGTAPGELYQLHSIAVDSKGNVYTLEEIPNNRVQKWVLKGMSSRAPSS
jgi:DNA-binding beta-propeller fold protein YncE